MHVLYAEVLSSRLTEVQLNQSRLTELILPRKEPESNKYCMLLCVIIVGSFCISNKGRGADDEEQEEQGNASSVYQSACGI